MTAHAIVLRCLKALISNTGMKEDGDGGLWWKESDHVVLSRCHL